MSRIHLTLDRLLELVKSFLIVLGIFVNRLDALKRRIMNARAPGSVICWQAADFGVSLASPFIDPSFSPTASFLGNQ
jgi:hypothetical protein